MGKNIIFICTSGKDRSPALVSYFREVYPENLYKSAGINEYFCKKHGTNLLTQADIELADLLVYAEDIHYSVATSKFQTGNKEYVILNCGEYKKDSSLADDFIMKSHNKLAHHLHEHKNNPPF